MSEPQVKVIDFAVDGGTAGNGTAPESIIRLPCVFVGCVPLFPIASDGQSRLLSAFAKAQSKFKVAVRDHENLGFSAPGKGASRYADLASVHDACMEALNANQLSVMHFTVPIADAVYLLTRIAHESGEWMQSAFPLTTLETVRQSIADAAKVQSSTALATTSAGLGGGEEQQQKKKRAPTVQALGSEITYLRRYCLCALAGITIDDDDDGNAASASVQNRQPAPTQPRPRAQGLG
jgi:hypothetical protein